MSNRSFVSVCSALAVLYCLGTFFLLREVDALNAQVQSQKKAISALVASFEKFETCQHMQGSVAGTTMRQTSPTELEKPNGPMPKAMLLESKRLKSDPPAGADVTSRLKTRRPKPSPCLRPCEELATCSIKGLCPALDTRRQDEVADVCFQACQASVSLKKTLVTTTDCRRFGEIARQRINGFAALCTPGVENK